MRRTQNWIMHSSCPQGADIWDGETGEYPTHIYVWLYLWFNSDLFMFLLWIFLKFEFWMQIPLCHKTKNRMFFLKNRYVENLLYFAHFLNYHLFLRHLLSISPFLLVWGVVGKDHSIQKFCLLILRNETSHRLLSSWLHLLEREMSLDTLICIGKEEFGTARRKGELKRPAKNRAKEKRQREWDKPVYF